jgi:hypothetical protein
MAGEGKCPLGVVLMSDADIFSHLPGYSCLQRPRNPSASQQRLTTEKSGLSIPIYPVTGSENIETLLERLLRRICSKGNPRRH